MNEEQAVTLTREQLYNEIWTLSVAGVAKKYNAEYLPSFPFVRHHLHSQKPLYDVLSKPFEKDYKRLCDVVRDSIGIRNITDVSSMLASYNHKQVTKDIKEINKLFDNNEDFKNILEILKFNNPNIK